ncbi:hypothetical protein [Microcella indica]|uniref:hypothetical protein n=1 Tax=Microcella indica TaxID=2750620 RepID=UPI0015CEF834|nr:hypothetical protein [Microcella indica]
MTEPSQIFAFLDESAISDEKGPGTYLLCAVVCNRSQLDELRQVMQNLQPRGARKLHWHGLSRQPARRAHWLAALNTLSLMSVVVARAGNANERPERQRRKCMERLVQTLHELRVEEIIAESRGRADDKRDVEHFVRMQSRQLPGATIRIHHKPGPQDPALWSADAVVGAVAASIKGEERYIEQLTRYTLITLAP